MKTTTKKKRKLKVTVKTIDQLTLARMIAQKRETTISEVMDIITEEQKLTMQFVGQGYRVIKKNYLTIESKKFEGKKDWISPLNQKKYTIPDRRRVLVRIGDGFKNYINEEQTKDDRLCRFVATKNNENVLENDEENA